jgi:hypothetical protein
VDQVIEILEVRDKVWRTAPHMVLFIAMVAMDWSISSDGAMQPIQRRS